MIIYNLAITQDMLRAVERQGIWITDIYSKGQLTAKGGRWKASIVAARQKAQQEALKREQEAEYRRRIQKQIEVATQRKEQIKEKVPDLYETYYKEEQARLASQDVSKIPTRVSQGSAFYRDPAAEAARRRIAQEGEAEVNKFLSTIAAPKDIKEQYAEEIRGFYSTQAQRVRVTQEKPYTGVGKQYTKQLADFEGTPQERAVALINLQRDVGQDLAKSGIKNIKQREKILEEQKSYSFTNLLTSEEVYEKLPTKGGQKYLPVAGESYIKYTPKQSAGTYPLVISQVGTGTGVPPVLTPEYSEALLAGLKSYEVNKRIGYYSKEYQEIKYLRNAPEYLRQKGKEKYPENDFFSNVQRGLYFAQADVTETFGKYGIMSRYFGIGAKNTLKPVPLATGIVLGSMAGAGGKALEYVFKGSKTGTQIVKAGKALGGGILATTYGYGKKQEYDYYQSIGLSKGEAAALTAGGITGETGTFLFSYEFGQNIIRQPTPKPDVFGFVKTEYGETILGTQKYKFPVKGFGDAYNALQSEGMRLRRSIINADITTAYENRFRAEKVGLPFTIETRSYIDPITGKVNVEKVGYNVLGYRTEGVKEIQTPLIQEDVTKVITVGNTPSTLFTFKGIIPKEYRNLLESSYSREFTEKSIAKALSKEALKRAAEDPSQTFLFEPEVSRIAPREQRGFIVQVGSNEMFTAREGFPLGFPKEVFPSVPKEPPLSQTRLVTGKQDVILNTYFSGRVKSAYGKIENFFKQIEVGGVTMVAGIMERPTTQQGQVGVGNIPSRGTLPDLSRIREVKDPITEYVEKVRTQNIQPVAPIPKDIFKAKQSYIPKEEEYINITATKQTDVLSGLRKSNISVFQNLGEVFGSDIGTDLSRSQYSSMGLGAGYGIDLGGKRAGKGLDLSKQRVTFGVDNYNVRIPEIDYSVGEIKIGGKVPSRGNLPQPTKPDTGRVVPDIDRKYLQGLGIGAGIKEKGLPIIGFAIAPAYRTGDAIIPIGDNKIKLRLDEQQIQIPQEDVIVENPVIPIDTQIPPPPRVRYPPPPIIDEWSFDWKIPPPRGGSFDTGFFDFELPKRKKRKKQEKRYTPTLFSVVSGLTGKPTKGGIISGFGIRPIRAR